MNNLEISQLHHRTKSSDNASTKLQGRLQNYRPRSPYIYCICVHLGRVQRDEALGSSGYGVGLTFKLSLAGSQCFPSFRPVVSARRYGPSFRPVTSARHSNSTKKRDADFACIVCMLIFLHADVTWQHALPCSHDDGNKAHTSSACRLQAKSALCIFTLRSQKPPIGLNSVLVHYRAEPLT